MEPEPKVLLRSISMDPWWIQGILMGLESLKCSENWYTTLLLYDNQFNRWSQNQKSSKDPFPWILGRSKAS